jgi:hypothetical protein
MPASQPSCWSGGTIRFDAETYSSGTPSTSSTVAEPRLSRTFGE